MSIFSACIKGQGGNVAADADLKDRKREMAREHHILLLGTGQSGKSTFAKQLRVHYHDNGGNDIDCFKPDEIDRFGKHVKRNVIMALHVLSRTFL